MKIRVEEAYPKSCVLTPVKAYPEDAGFDLRTRLDFKLGPGDIACVPTGYIWEIPVGYCGIIKGRSGLAIKHEIYAFNGVIDSTYRGEVIVSLEHRGVTPYIFSFNDRVAQMLVLPVPAFELEVGKVSKTIRGENGFGSTGK